MTMSSSSGGSPKTTFCVPGSRSDSILQRKVTLLEATKLADVVPFEVGHRLDREARISHQDHVLEFGLGLDRGERDGLRHVLHRLDVDETEAAGFIGWVLAVFADDLDDADDPLLIAR